MLKIAISGSTGLIGSRIQELLYHDFEFIPLLQQHVDITNKDQVWNFLKDIDFDIFLHLAAYTNVDQAEKEKELVYKINVEGTRNVFNAVLQRKKKFIQISTDFVFSGEHHPYLEDSKPDAHFGVYALSKFEAEKVITNQAMIARLSFPYRAKYEARPDLVRTLKSLLEQGREISVITDSLITPTFIDDIAHGLQYLLQNYTPQIFHLVGNQSLSPYEAVMKIADVFNLNKSLIKKTNFREFYKGKAPRPKMSVIKSKKNNFYKMKSLDQGLLEIKKQIRL